MKIGKFQQQKFRVFAGPRNRFITRTLFVGREFVIFLIKNVFNGFKIIR